VKFIQKNLSTGSAVYSGRELFRISGADLNTGTNIDVDIQQAKFEASAAEEEFNRAKELMEDYLITKDKYQQVLLHYQNSRLKLNHLRKNYAHSGKKLAASTAGFINSVLVQEGDYVTAGQPLATFTKNKRVLLQVNVPLRESNSIQGIREANFILQQSQQLYNTTSFNGKMISVAKTSFENTPWLPLFFEIDNHAEWIPGSYADVFLKTNFTNNVLAVPSAAILEEQGYHYLFIQLDAEHFEKREIEPGTDDGQKIEIKKGLSPGERVVIQGAYQIKLASSVNTSNIHDHAH
jgi:membrane fusion protein, heavy metal efflux system